MNVTVTINFERLGFDENNIRVIMSKIREVGGIHKKAKLIDGRVEIPATLTKDQCEKLIDSGNIDCIKIRNDKE
jgi:hypothetical protein